MVEVDNGAEPVTGNETAIDVVEIGTVVGVTVN
jgi:hypothetical protein